MEAPSTPTSSSQSAFQHRQQEKARQAKFFKFAVPIALVLHGITIGGGAFLMGRGGGEVAIEEVEIIADNKPDEKPDEKLDMNSNQPIDPNGQGGDFAGGGGGGGSSKFSLFQAEGGTREGNNVAALGNPFGAPDLNPIEGSIVNSEPAETVPEEAIDPETPKNSPKTEAKTTQNPQPIAPPNSNKLPNSGELNGTKEGKGQQGNPNGGKLNSKAAMGVGRDGGAGTGTGNGTGRGNGNGSGSGSGNGSGNNSTGKSGRSGIKPGAKPPEKPVGQPVAKPTEKSVQPSPSIAIVSPPPAKPKKGPRCVENCNLDEYLGAEGKADVRLKVDRDGNVIEATLGSSSGNAEVDRKALEYAKTRKYQPSDEGFNSNLPITSQQEGSEFARQQEERRRRQEQADRDRAIPAPEPVSREAERPSTPEPVAPPVAAPVVEPPVVEPPVVEPVAPPASVAPTIPEPVAEPIVPATPVPVAPPVAEPIVTPPEPVTPQPTVAEPIAPVVPEAPAVPSP